MSNVYEVKDVYSRQDVLAKGGAFNVNAPSQTRRDQFDILRRHVAPTNEGAYKLLTDNDVGMVVGAPYSLHTYREKADEGLVYAGKMKDPVTGQEFHTFENAMPEKEVDESLNPSFHSMERLTEVAMGSTHGDIRRKMGMKDHKPEDNNMIAPLSGDQAFRKEFGHWDSVRLWDLDRAKQESRRKQENNFAGIDERVGGPTGYVGLHPMQYARKEDNQVQVTAYELDDRARLNNAMAKTVQHGAWAQPTTYQRQDPNKTWQQSGKWGNAFGMREVNEFPGDREAKRAKPSFIENKPEVQVILM